jgi:hypothetical protein
MYLNVENGRFLYNCTCSCIPLNWKYFRKETHESPLFTIQWWKLNWGLDGLGQIFTEYFRTSSNTAELTLAVRHFAVFFTIQLTEGEPLECPPVLKNWQICRDRERIFDILWTEKTGKFRSYAKIQWNLN